jgi:hypothetical protein
MQPTAYDMYRKSLNLYILEEKQAILKSCKLSPSDNFNL